MASPLARRLRKDSADAERRLCAHLRCKRLDGFRFRRQQPIGPYVVDFFCPEARLIIEVDGKQHALTIDKDEKRTAWLQSRGYAVVRFWNNDVLQNTDGVLSVIREALAAAPPTPTLPLEGGGGKLRAHLRAAIRSTKRVKR